MFGNTQVDAKALAFPGLIIGGKKVKPVVVKTSQGASPTGSNEDSQLVPAGPKALEAGHGGWPVKSNLPWRSNQNEPKDDGKKFPVRLFHLVDVSSSMGSKLHEVEGSPTRLDYVKQSIEKLVRSLPKGLKDGIEHILIPYGETTGEAQVFTGKDEKAFLKAVNNLTKSYGTNIFKPIEEVVNFIKDSTDKQMRNLAILFSDGQHLPRTDGAESEDNAVTKFADLEEVNSATFNVGIGSSYKRSFMIDSLRNAKFGGLAHIPNSKGDANLYESVLPEFIQDLTSAPQYPIISFNEYFDQVINMNPTARKVDKSEADAKTQKVIEANEHFKAVAGFQSEAFNVGFTQEDKIDTARIFKLVKGEGNSKSFDETQELTIQDFDQAILDPSEREQYQQHLIIALKNLLLDSDNPRQALEEFFAENQLPDYIREKLQPLLEKLQGGPMNAQDENSFIASQSVSINRTVIDGPEIHFKAPDEGDLNTLRHDVSRTQVGTGKAVEQIGVNNLDSIVDIPNADLKAVTLSFTNPKGDEVGSFNLQEEGCKVIIIGRAEETDLRLDNQNISRHHAEIQFKDGKVYIIDKKSKNGTKLNFKSLEPEVETRLKPQDTIKIGENTLKVHFRAS